MLLTKPSLFQWPGWEGQATEDGIWGPKAPGLLATTRHWGMRPEKLGCWLSLNYSITWIWGARESVKVGILQQPLTTLKQQQERPYGVFTSQGHGGTFSLSSSGSVSIFPVKLAIAGCPSVTAPALPPEPLVHR